MAPSAPEWDLWSSSCRQDTVPLDVLLPNGYFLNLKARADATLLQIKMDVWDAAQQCPLYDLLSDMESYVFTCINSATAEQEEQVEESKRLCDVRPFHAMLRLVERKGDTSEKILNAQIRVLIGKGLHEFEAQKSPEINHFRKRMRLFSENIANELNNVSAEESWNQRLLRLKPVDVDEDNPGLPPYLASKIHDGRIVVSVHMEHSGSKSKCKFSVQPDITPSQLVEVILSKKAHTAGLLETKDDWLLKICGLQEYLVGPYLLSQYSYIRDMISSDKIPELLLLSMKSIQQMEQLLDVDKSQFRPRLRSDMTHLTKKVNEITTTSWSIEDPFAVVIHGITHLSNDNLTKVAIEMGVYHGDEPLCKCSYIQQKAVEEGECNWQEEVQFQDLTVSNLPRMAKLCICVFELSKVAKGSRAKKYPDNKQDFFANPIAWVNCTVFDFSGTLKCGKLSLYMWPYEDDLEADVMINPLGGVATHPLHEQAAMLTISFNNYGDSAAVSYPTLATVMDYAKSLSKKNGDDSSAMPQASKSHLKQLKEICEKDSLYQLHEQEKELMWFLRVDCCVQLPQSLPKLLKCLKWNDRQEVAQMTLLIQTWPTLPPVKALELLDYAFPDQEVRKFAVGCLQAMSDKELSLYSLQLVRALKHESYHHCDLVEFLLSRALRNRHIGHKIFWLLKSEMNFLEVSTRFGLILEAYCRGATDHLHDLIKQVQALSNLKIANELFQNEGNRRKENKEKLKTLIQDLLNQECYQEIFRGLQNPLDCRFKFQKLRVERCKFFDSKMKPLWLVFENYDSDGKDIFIIFKNGDDLRQDMLTLQMIRIMDRMWKEEGLDFRMIPYQCLATDYKVGLIEVVPHADTIANIQKEKGFTATSAFKKGSILAWLKDHNPDEKSLSKAAEEFTLSCAGYCVATYVLGIADRHSDNIMIQTNGRLFHIDFGHILGKFKEKFGFKRERVPFVLTHDFVYIITKGHTQKSQEFNRFQQYCEQAFMILRKKGPLMISLFAMMLSTGIPELSNEKDLDYLRETLVLDMAEQEALQHFRSKFDEALRSSWKTSVNWMAHNLAKDNKNEANR